MPFSFAVLKIESLYDLSYNWAAWAKLLKMKLRSSSDKFHFIPAFELLCYKYTPFYLLYVE
jgi:hypothetical protein